MIYIETQHLYIRDWKRSDLQSLVALNRDSNVMKYFLKTLTPTESIGLFNRFKDNLDNQGYGLFAIERKEDQAFIGFVGFNTFDFDTDFAPGIEIAWRLHTDYWNKGYATEAAQACLKYARENLDFETVYSFTTRQNKRSEQVMIKIGMTKVKEFEHPQIPKDHPLLHHVLYRIKL